MLVAYVLGGVGVLGAAAALADCQRAIRREQGGWRASARFSGGASSHSHLCAGWCDQVRTSSDVGGSVFTNSRSRIRSALRAAVDVSSGSCR